MATSKKNVPTQLDAMKNIVNFFMGMEFEDCDSNLRDSVSVLAHMVETRENKKSTPKTLSPAQQEARDARDAKDAEILAWIGGKSVNSTDVAKEFGLSVGKAVQVLKRLHDAGLTEKETVKGKVMHKRK